MKHIFLAALMAVATPAWAQSNEQLARDNAELQTMKRLLPLCLLLLPGLALAEIPGMTTWTINGWTIAFWGAMYLLPSIVAMLRNTNMIALVILVNFFLGWTMIGWIVALIMAIKGESNTWRPRKRKY